MKLTRKTVQQWLHNYWAGGSTKLALIPKYKSRGGSGKSRLNTENKVGRPNIYKSSNQGIIIGEEEQKQIERIIKKYYNKNEKYTYKYCYEQLLRIFYTDENGSLLSAYPTMTQFRYHAKKFLNERSRIGEKKFDRNFRALHGNSMSEAEGPGEKYQIDATIADVYLVSMTDRNLVVGRPVLYFVTDVFSHAIVGFYISLEGPSWLDAMMAVYYTVMDKVDFCKQFGIEITESQWPCKGLPQQLMTDNGELVSKKSNELVERLGIHMQNASAWRPDMKAIVEQSFHMFNGSTKIILPGGIQPDFSERGGKDYRLDATLNLHEFYQMMIRFCLRIFYIHSIVFGRDCTAFLKNK